jgi:hypothetical protein
MIDVTCWAPDRATACSFLKAVGIAELDPSGQTHDLRPIADVLIHPFREAESLTVVKVPAVMDGMTVVTPAVIAPGFHFNLRFHSASADTLRAGLPQVGSDGKLLGLFERTHILDLVDARTGHAPAWVAIPGDPIAPGYQSADGVRAFDPATLTHIRNVWA